MKKYICLVLVSLTMFLTGCGREMKLSIRPSEADKDQPQAELVRKIDVSYRDGSGVERMRQSLAVFGFSQPVSIKSELIKDLEKDPNGKFEAKGYASDGLMLLAGSAPASSDAVEIVLSREAGQASVAGSALLRKMRVGNAPALSELVIDQKALRETVGTKKCVELPRMEVNASSGLLPTLQFEGSIKAPKLYALVEGSLSKPKTELPIGANGEAVFDLATLAAREQFLGKPQDLKISVFSDVYEGCVAFKSRPVFEPVTAQFISAGQVKKLEGEPGGNCNPNEPMTPRGVIRLNNPNSVPVTVQLTVYAVDRASSARHPVCYRTSDGEVSMNIAECKDPVFDKIALKARDAIDYRIYGWRETGLEWRLRYKNYGFSLQWELRVNPDQVTDQPSSYSERGGCEIP